MGEIELAGRPLAEYTDPELVAWMNENRPPGGYKLRKKTAALWVATFRVFDGVGPPMTVRQVFYALTSRGLVPKTEGGYNTVQYHVLQMRRAGVLPYSFISDSTRWMRKPETYTGLQAYFEHGRKAYRRALWDNQNAYVEIWLEKDALGGVFSQITEAWDVPLMITRGYPSETFVFEAAETIKAQVTPCFVYAFYDLDPSGENIAENTEAKLKGFGAEVAFQLVAVQPWQVEAWGLPTRPTKKSDTRAKNWRGPSVELDAIPVDRLRWMIESVIEQHVNQAALEWQLQTEEAEREMLGRVLHNLGLALDSEQGAEEVASGPTD